MDLRFHFSLACFLTGMFFCTTPTTVAVQAATGQAAPGAIDGTVKDASGAVVPGATVTLENAASTVNRVSVSGGDENFHFAVLEPGTYTVTIAARGFAVWTTASVAVRPGESQALPPAVLQVAPASGTVDVALSPHDVAAEQLQVEEKQRLYGLMPNFKISYVPNATPLATGQKFQLAWATTVDPFTILFTGAVAGYEQKRNNLRGYGQGSIGYAKRFGANYADVLSGEMIDTAILPSLFHQDPRYFYKGTGSILSRALYAIANTVICKGDHGHWQPNYSSILGNFAAGGLSNLYYPASSRGVRVTIVGGLLDNVFIAGNNLFEEVLSRQLTPSATKTVAAGTRLILREGAPVPLIVTEGLNFRTAEKGQSAALALASDIKVGGVIVAKRGSNAVGEVAYRGNSGELELHIRYLQVAGDQVMLRASKQKEGYSGIGALGAAGIPAGTAVTVYVAGDISLPVAN